MSMLKIKLQNKYFQYWKRWKDYFQQNTLLTVSFTIIPFIDIYFTLKCTSASQIFIFKK